MSNRSVRNCNVCVVGGAGFLGSHLVNHLIDDRGCNVVVVDNLAAGWREFVHPKAKFVHHDITGSESYLLNLFRSEQIRFVFNYSALPYVPDSYARPLRVFDVNAFGAMKVINAAQEAGCEAILQVSSAELYGDGPASSGSRAQEDAGFKITEEGSVSPHSSYGAAKAAIDALVQVRWREAGTPVIALRQFNCVGERETHPYVVPEVISQLAAYRNLPVVTMRVETGRFETEPESQGVRFIQKPFVVRLGNNSLRDFLYAGDAVRMATELLERGQFGEVYNLGSETGIKVYDLARLIGKVMGFADVKVEEDASRKRPWEIWHLQSDNSKLRAACRAGGSPNDPDWGLTPLEEALRRTVAWFEGNGRKWPWEK